MYGNDAQAEITQLRRDVQSEIDDKKKPESLRYLLFKMTNRCNSDCEYCSHAISNASNEVKLDIPTEVVLRTIEQASELGCTAMAINGGEPLLRNDIVDIVKKTVASKIVPVLMTNGLLLPQMWRSLGDAGLRYVIISFDSVDPAIYELQRGAKFEQAMRGIESAMQMMEEYPGTHVHVSAVLTKDNQDDFLHTVEFMTERGIAVQISPYHHYDSRTFDNISIRDREAIESLSSKLLEMKKAGALIASSTGFIEHLPNFFIKGQRLPNDYRCKIGFTNLFIDASMNVRPCWDWCFQPLGNLETDSLEELWHGEMMERYRMDMLANRCEGCWYMCTGEVTMLLDNML
ncbi:MAG: radical SAM protein [Eggerthellaceae bacterium]|nr:radical SAM protein [Eggerthellaceae bacterium]